MISKEMPDSDYLAELSALGIASRLRRLLQRLLKNGEEVNREGGNDFLGAVGKLERALHRRSMYDRIMVQFRKRTEPKDKMQS